MTDQTRQDENRTRQAENRTRQVEMWDGDFGKRYVERHPTTVEGFDELREEQYGPGTTQTKLMEESLGHLDRESRILEVGANIGIQLRILRNLGFENLYGIDVQSYAVETCHRDAPELDVIEANAFDVPFKDGYFDLVFTNEMLVTIPPDLLDTAIDEIVRCSSQYVWGLEFYADEYTEIEWRGEDEMLWKTDFVDRYQQRHDLRLVDSKFLEYQDNDDVDRLFLLEKREEGE